MIESNLYWKNGLLDSSSSFTRHTRKNFISGLRLEHFFRFLILARKRYRFLGIAFHRHYRDRPSLDPAESPAIKLTNSVEQSSRVTAWRTAFFNVGRYISKVPATSTFQHENTILIGAVRNRLNIVRRGRICVTEPLD